MVEHSIKTPKEPKPSMPKHEDMKMEEQSNMQRNSVSHF